MATKHTKQMYVVVNDKNEPLWSSLSLMPPFLDTFDNKAGYTVQPVTVTIELNTKQDDRDKTES